MIRRSLAWAFLVPAFLALPLGAGEAAGEELKRTVEPFVSKGELAGAVMLVANTDKILDAEAVGWADIGSGRAMKVDDLFWIASQSKPITGAALMILVDEGKVKLDDPLETYLPEFRGMMYVAERSEGQKVLRKTSHPITLREVLSHTSGMPFKSAIEEPTLDAWPLKLRVKSYAMTPLDTDPGTAYQYSNAGINTAARVIEVVTGQSFEAFLGERLFQPLGMVDTTFWPTEAQASRIASAYRPGPGKKGLEMTKIEQLHYPLTDRAERFPMPAGGLFSTAQDLAKFYQMLLNQGEFQGKRYLSKEAVRALTTKQTPSKLKDGYGLGFSVGGDGSFGHGGAYSTNTTADVKNHLITIWLVQHAGFPGEGEKAQGAFREAAIKAFGGSK